MIKALLKKTNHSFKQGLIIQLKKNTFFIRQKQYFYSKKNQFLAPISTLKLHLSTKKKHNKNKMIK